MIGLSVAIPAASLCINRRLYLIATKLSVTPFKADKHREVATDLAIGLGIPFLEMILRRFIHDIHHSQRFTCFIAEYVVQGHRFNIFEDIGCYPVTYNTPVSFLLVYCWPVVIGLVSAVYCCKCHIIIVVTCWIFNSSIAMTISAVVKRRSELSQIFAGIDNFNSSHHFRLMSLAGIELLLGIPWCVYACLYLNISAKGASESPIHPYQSWANVHAKFWNVDQFPAFQWKQNHTTITSLELSRWASVICAFIFFGFFGFAQEARKNYRLAFNSVAKRFRHINFMHSRVLSSPALSRSMTSTSRGTIPIFIRHDPCTSFSTNLSLGDVGGTLDHVNEPHSPTN